MRRILALLTFWTFDNDENTFFKKTFDNLYQVAYPLIRFYTGRKSG